MCTVDEIKKTYDEIVRINKNLILMNCTSEYPPKYEHQFGIYTNYETKIYKGPHLMNMITHQQPTSSEQLH